MPGDSFIQIGKHKLKLTNLDKVLFPEAHIIKAEVIQYYLKMAPYLLRHIKHRPLTFIRYPEGISEEGFFQKNRPQYAPEWIQSVKMGKEKKLNYILATNEASLAWLANQACIEFHQTTARYPDLDKPDHFVFDLDPPEGMNFEAIKNIAFDLKSELHGYGYLPFVKTSGRKGIHICTPIKPRWTHNEIRETLKTIARDFVSSHPDTTTTNIRKESRKGKVFIDIVRNAQSQTTACPYTLRATPSGTVSMPLTWDQLERVSSPDEFTIANAYEYIQENGDAWEGFGAAAKHLHDRIRKGTSETSKNALQAYLSKRNFNKTTEPVPGDGNYSDDAFVIHRHSASHLHYDLRLANDGVLQSWALPKGMPGAPGIKHLAVETEAHPMEYLEFEGTIPKGQYGAGEIWVMANGNYRITKKKKEGFYFKLESTVLDCEYRMHRMKGKEWLLERVDPSNLDLHSTIMQPMLCQTVDDVPSDINMMYEVKWDGIRALLYIDEEGMVIRSRSGRDITAQFPEVVRDRSYLRCTRAILDGEIVSLDDRGKPMFKEVISRLNKSGNKAIQRASQANQAYFYLFDVLYLDGCHTRKIRLDKRRGWVGDMIKPGGTFRLSEALEDGEALFDATRKMQLEGIIAKRRDSYYHPGKRSDSWLKIKHRKSILCNIIGFTEGKGDREQTFGALHIASAEDDNPVYLGKVGTGFTEKSLMEIADLIRACPATGKPVEQRVEDEKTTTWINCDVPCEVAYASLTSNSTLREPVFLRLRNDLSK